MTTDEVFEELIRDRKRCLEIGMSPSNYRVLLKRFRDNDPLLTIQNKMQWLEKAGYRFKITWESR